MDHVFNIKLKYKNSRKKNTEQNLWSLGLGDLTPKAQFIKEKKYTDFIKVLFCEAHVRRIKRQGTD